MPRATIRTPRRLGDPRGTILIISLLLLVVATFLTGLILLLARTDATLSATSWGKARATNAAEYGIEFAINSLDPSQAATAFAPQTLGPDVTVTPGLRDSTSASARNLGASACPPGYSTSLGCSGYTFTATGWARAWLVTTASTQLEKSEAIYRGCNGSEYSC